MKFNNRKPIDFSELSECHSFFLENTFTDDDTPLFVEHSTITAETGGLLVNKDTDNPVTSEELERAKFFLFTENKLSETDDKTSYCQTLLSTHIIH